MQRGFSLVELSIVLVILGLLTGGILAGQSLIRAAELRSLTSEYQRYTAATQAFRDKYFAIPGDMSNAQSFWGVAHATPATCVTTVGTGTQTCNGDGGGTLNVSTGSNEFLRFWQHLANAGLLEGSYTGVQGTPYYIPGVNAPPSRLSGNLWLATSVGVNAGTTVLFAGDYGNVFGSPGSNGNYALTTAGSLGLKPEEAWNIDTKMDDGKPSSGRVGAYKGNGTNTNCTTGAGTAPPGDNASTATYVLTNTAADCLMLFSKAF